MAVGVGPFVLILTQPPANSPRGTGMLRFRSEHGHALARGTELLRAGEVGEAVAQLVEARRALADAGDQAGAARADIALALAVAARGEIERATAWLDEALALSDVSATPISWPACAWRRARPRRCAARTAWRAARGSRRDVTSRSTGTARRWR